MSRSVQQEGKTLGARAWIQWQFLEACPYFPHCGHHYKFTSLEGTSCHVGLRQGSGFPDFQCSGCCSELGGRLTIELGADPLDLRSKTGIERKADVLDLRNNSCNTRDIVLHVDLLLDPSEDIGDLTETPKAVTTGLMEGGICSACVGSPHGNFSVNPFDMPLDHVSAKGHNQSSTRGPMCYVSGHDVLDPLLSLSSCTDSFEYGKKKTQCGMTHSGGLIKKAVQEAGCFVSDALLCGEKRTQSGMTESGGSFEKSVQEAGCFVSDALLCGKSWSHSAILDKRYVYKRKKLRHSVTLLSEHAHAAFTKESVQRYPPSNSDQPKQECKIEILLDTEVNPRGHCKISTAGPEISQPDENKVISETDINDKLDAKKPVSEYQICNIDEAGNIIEKEEFFEQHNKSDTSTMEISNYLLQPGESTLYNGSNQIINVNFNWNRSKDILPHEESNFEVEPRSHCKICTAGPEILHPDENKDIVETDVDDKLDAVQPVSDYQICNIEKAVNNLEKEQISKQDDKRDTSNMEIANYLLQPGKTTLNSGSNQILNVNCNGNQSRCLSTREESNCTSQSESSSFPYNFERKVGTQECYVEATCNSRSDSGSFTTLSYQIMNNNQDKLSEVGEFEYCLSDAARVAEGRDLEREWCISILNESKLIFVSPGISAVTEHPGVVGDGKWNKRCKVCYTLENSTSTLICDMCEESFHMACCNPKVVSIPVNDNWYCPACSKKRKRSVVREEDGLFWHEARQNRHLLEFSSRGTVKADCENFIKEKNGRFWCMFQNDEAYTTQVRLGKDYQADVPVWTGKVMDFAESPFMGEFVYSAEQLLELELTEHSLKNDSRQKDRDPTKCLTPGSKENWLQCQNVLFREGEALPDGRKAKKDIICGKWRRAPVTEVQTDEWDCSCAVVWDPLHADCAVPQELATEDIVGRLKASKMQDDLLVSPNDDNSKISLGSWERIVDELGSLQPAGVFALPFILAFQLHVDFSAWENEKHF